MERQTNDWWRRGLRTLIQFVAGGGITELADRLVLDIPDQYDFYVIFLAGTLVALCQNYAEDMGWIPAVFKARTSTGENPVPK